jgi:hypothetical protein
MDPASCPHREACWTPVEFGCWRYLCSRCGLEAFGLTLPAAKTLFGLKAEKAKVEAIKAKPPPQRTPEDWTWLHYSPFGNASKCGY